MSSSEFMQARLGEELEQALRTMMTAREYPRGGALFRQGATATGLYLVERGSVRVLLAAAENQNQLLEVVSPGALLGLSDSVTGDRYRVTAVAAEPTVAGFVDRGIFLEFLSSQHELCMQVVRLLSDNLHGLYHKFRNVSAHPGRPRRRSLNQRLS